MREQVVEVESTRESREAALSRSLDMANMKAEEERLASALAAAKDRAKVANVRAGSDALFDAANEAAKVAAQQEAARVAAAEAEIAAAEAQAASDAAAAEEAAKANDEGKN